MASATGVRSAPLPLEAGHGYRLRELADVLGIHYSTVSRRIARAERSPA